MVVCATIIYREVFQGEVVWQCSGRGRLNISINNDSIVRNVDFNFEFMSSRSGSVTFLGSVTRGGKKTLVSRQIDFYYEIIHGGALSGHVKSKSKSEWDTTHFEVMPMTKNPRVTIKKLSNNNYIIYNNGEPFLVCSSDEFVGEV
jgi:hypothetical protein